MDGPILPAMTADSGPLEAMENERECNEISE